MNGSTPEGGLLLLSGCSPGGLGVGQLYLGSICSLLDEPILVVDLGDDERHGCQDSAFPSIRLSPRFEPAWRPSATKIGRVLNWAGVRACLIPHSRRLANSAVEFARARRPRAVLAVLDTPTVMLTAADVAARLGASLHCLVWDMPEYLLARRGHAPLSAAPMMKGFDRAMRKSARVAVMSDAMRSEIAARHGVQSEVLHQPIDPSWGRAVQQAASNKDGEFVIGFAGSVTARDEMEVLMRALDRCDWVLGGRPVRVRVFGLRLVCQATTARCIEYRGYLPRVEDVVAGLAECDLLFLPQPFGNAHESFSRYSFPTKLTTYLAAGRPIFLLAPEYGTLSRFFIERQMPLVCTKSEPAEVLQRLQDLVADLELPERARAHAAVMADQDFGQTLCRQRLSRFLDRSQAVA